MKTTEGKKIGSQARGVEQSWQLYERAAHYIPMGTQTHSKAPRAHLRTQEPCFIVRGKGCRVWDLDGNEYIDLRNGLGPITLGYGFPAVDEALRRQLESGTVFSYAHPLEVEVAASLAAAIPCAESVRFLKTGGESMAAVHRLARAFTGRDHILTCGYHGWLNTTTRAGVPAAIRSVYQAFPWGDIDSCAREFAQNPEGIAAVSVACGYGDIAAGHTFLPALRELSRQYGALLIFDEIVTGFRLRLGGAQEYFGVVPDLAVFAKGMSNGVPLSCYLGRREIMDRVEEVSISSTYGGDALGLAAAAAVLQTYDDEDVIGTLWQRGQQLHKGFGVLCRDLGIAAGFKGLPPVGELVFEHADPARRTELFVRFNAEVLKRGLIVYSVCYPNYSHTSADIEEALAIIEEALIAMREEGVFECVHPVTGE